MPNRPELLHRRFVAFAISASKLSRRLPRDAAGQNVTRQLVRSSSSPMANYAEARDAETNAEYIHRMKICLKELRETAGWIEMAESISSSHLGTEQLLRECNELIAICVVCIKKARSHDDKNGEDPPRKRR